MTVAPAGAEQLPVAQAATASARVRRLVYVAAFGCAACGLTYELVLTILGGSLIGDTVVQTSLVISTMVFAMGMGALLAKPFLSRAASAFVICEPVVALLGGLAPSILLAAFAWMDVYEPVLVVIALLIGALVGAEIPLLLALVPHKSEGSFADLLAADYIGALAAGVAVPFLIVPIMGLTTGSMVVGLVNLAMGLIVLFMIGEHGPPRRTRLFAGAFTMIAATVLVLGMLGAPRFERSARQELFDDPIVHSQRTKVQEIVLTEEWRPAGERDLRLFLNGDLQFSSIDEYRYHEALVHPAMDGPRRRVLVLGGGDGLAVREVLRYRDVGEVVLVELDPAMVELAQQDGRLTSLNKRALLDPRVRIETTDAFRYLRKYSADQPRFDVVIVDLPDPDSLGLAKLYSVEFYTMAANAIGSSGRIVVQAGSPTFAADAYWSVEASMRAADLQVVGYHVDVPSFGDWGFFAAARGRVTPGLAVDAPPLRSLDTASLRAALSFAPDRARRRVEPSTLSKPTILTYQRNAWRRY
jgi:spermidine synthase